MVRSLKGAGVSFFQLREKRASKINILKDAQRIKYLLNNPESIFIVNDHVDVARSVNADGVHLGQDDLPIVEARKILGEDKIIGISCHSPSDAILAEKNGADYIGVGPIFATATKPELRPIGVAGLELIRRKVRLPIFAIGGINRGNVTKVLGAGNVGVAVCREICLSRNPAKAAKLLNISLS